MAEMTGVHVEYGVAVKVGSTGMFYPIWSETIAIDGTTTQAARGAPELRDLAEGGAAVFRVRAQVAGPVYVARGKQPNAGVTISTTRDNARAHLLAGESRDFPAMDGDKVACVSAS